ncbi:hypothetical protein J6590_010878 [Homalodisca vitripennis]|nr:hypothetical protein J6590_010878 [Homalodisca vitripennis]
MGNRAGRREMMGQTCSRPVTHEIGRVRVCSGGAAAADSPRSPEVTYPTSTHTTTPLARAQQSAVTIAPRRTSEARLALPVNSHSDIWRYVTMLHKCKNCRPYQSQRPLITTSGTDLDIEYELISSLES